MRMSSSSMMIHAYKFLRPCTNYRARTRSNAARSLCVGSPYHSDRSFIPTIQRDERVLVVWSDNLHSIIPQCLEFEEHLIKLVWTQRHSLMALDIGPSIPTTPAAASASTSLANSASDVQLNEKPKEQESVPAPFPAAESNAKPISGGSLWGWRIGSRAKRAPAARDFEHGGASSRPTRYFAPVYGGLGLALSTCAVSSSMERLLDADQQLQVFIGSGANILLQEFRLTHDYTRFALLATAPLLFCVSLVCSYSISLPFTI